MGALRDASPSVRTEALRALGARGARGALPDIASRLRDEDEAAAVRAAAAQALAALCDQSQLDELTRAARALLAEPPSPDAITLGAAALAAIGHIAPADLERRLAPFAEAGARPGLEQMLAAARRGGRCAASPAR